MAIWGIPFVLIGLFHDLRALLGRFVCAGAPVLRRHKSAGINRQARPFSRPSRHSAWIACQRFRWTVALAAAEPSIWGSNRKHSAVTQDRGLMPSLSSTPAFLAIEDASAVLALLSAPRSDGAMPFRSGDGILRISPAPGRPATQPLAVVALLVPVLLAGLVFAPLFEPARRFRRRRVSRGEVLCRDRGRL